MGSTTGAIGTVGMEKAPREDPRRLGLPAADHFPAIFMGLSAGFR